MENFWEKNELKKNKIDIVQVNLGNKCNLACNHCHMDAGPSGSSNMNEDIARKVVEKLKNIKVENVEFTGGEPLLNNNLFYFIEELSGIKNLSVRTNLLSMDLPEYNSYINLFSKHNVTIIGSLPSPFKAITDSQRGNHVFEKSIKILQVLNFRGYGKNLKLNLVYNPDGPYLPPDSKKLENEYRELLKKEYDIVFNKLYALINVPIKRFRSSLVKDGSLDEYENELRENYNEQTLDRIMCRSILSLDHEGNVYDCDFNLANGTKVKGYETKKFWEIDFDNFFPSITFFNYCYACTVNQGSSCHGTLIECEGNSERNRITDNVKKYYGEIVQKTSDLKSDACCTLESIPEHVKESMKYIHDEIIMKYYGCGSPIPLALEGARALDVGCGTGRDVYIMSRLVGESGRVYGIDMTKNQLNVAKKHVFKQMEVFGYKENNMEFILDYMENMGNHIKKESLDLVTSNCVLNLAADKEVVIQQIYDLLKPGGELYFSDVYADRRIPVHIAKNELLYGECLGGALYYKDFERIARKIGFADPRVMKNRKIENNNLEIRNLVENINFYSITYRLWKIEGLEDACEDYGHIAIYKGGIPYSPFKFELDGEHTFYKNKPERVCGNTALMLKNTRFSKYFEIIGDFSEHFGLFDGCSTNSYDDTETSSDNCC